MADVLARPGMSDGLSLPDPGPLGGLCARLLRLDAAALVRLRPAAPEGRSAGGVEAWAWTPLDVLVRQVVPGRVVGDVTLRADELLSAVVTVTDDGPHLVLPGRRDAQWRGTLPPAVVGPVVDTVPAEVLRRLVDAAAATLRSATAAGAGARRVGEAMLDQEVLTVTAGPVAAGRGVPGPVAVPLRVLLALARTGALAGPGPGGAPGPDEAEISASAAWTRVALPSGAAYCRRGPSLLLTRR